MKVTVLGSGCPKCETLYNKLKKLKEDGKIKADIEYKKGINELIERGIMGSPALLVNGKPVLVGMPKSDDELLRVILKKSK
ncbi:MAG: thioredoxin family protein [Candidatus Aenigmarchaeota archaeon]|nr:thioredoxin family protein [Candidatus Aenigmarchaeota archaeon]